ncbi:MAG: DUF1549 domain-containing protein, partial [Bryobacteraceae bacterium]
MEKCLIVLLMGACGIANAAVDYGRDVRPILSENCFLCHGQDAKKRMAGLRLDSFEGATAQRAGRAALVPGKLEASEIYARITAEPSKRMPPVYSNRTLTPEQVTTLKRWIESGGAYSKHWAFVPPQRPAMPQPRIDAFVRKRLEAEGLKPNPPAAPGAWLRRVSLDLTGLPPSLDELDSFAKEVATRGEAAYTAAVDRLLASPRYGERMAMDWMDVARYADTHGFNNDSARSMWRWRDWVIDSFNANMPYDRFITEQLAGDLLPNPTMNQRIATGFGRNHVINSEGGIIDEEYRVEYVTDRVRTLGMAWLGLTLECAHCHDHKFDPITQRDHYRFYAFFNNVPELGEDGRVTNAVPLMPAPTSEQQMRIAELQDRIARLTPPDQFHEQQRNAGTTPGGAVWQYSCASACTPGETSPKPGVPVSKRKPLTFSAWINPGESDTNVALLSAMDYSVNPVATTYGKGMEFRLVGGELEFRFGDRFPAYEIRVRSQGANFKPGQWRHVALTYDGAEGKTSMRAETSWVRLFVDGREVGVKILNEGFTLPDEKSDKPSPTVFRIGWDNAAKSQRYSGLLDQIAFWPRVLTDDEIAGLVDKAGIPDKEKPLQSSRKELFAIQRKIPTVMVMQEMATPRETHVLLRGGYNTPGEKVEPGVPEALLGAWPVGAPKNRLGLAQWLTKPDHPLTARVVVNRFWQQVFGLGIVKTSDNFGLQGESPSHPELLDWLALEFIDSGWNVKALMKQMVLSATYRQDASASPEMFTRDPENRLLARGPRFRLPGELIRDQALFLSGLLKNRLGGPSVFPYQTKDLYKGIVVAADIPGTKYIESQGDDLYRRSLYTFWKRTAAPGIRRSISGDR